MYAISTARGRKTSSSTILYRTTNGSVTSGRSPTAMASYTRYLRWYWLVALSWSTTISPSRSTFWCGGPTGYSGRCPDADGLRGIGKRICTRATLLDRSMRYTPWLWMYIMYRVPSAFHVTQYLCFSMRSMFVRSSDTGCEPGNLMSRRPGSSTLLTQSRMNWLWSSGSRSPISKILSWPGGPGGVGGGASAAAAPASSSSSSPTPFQLGTGGVMILDWRRSWWYLNRSCR
mmetsp:Transcript_25693/g.76053  ORF Transcript_25693/g.76053 Transcript_25693/m.76053 type:complete len:231 (-) Transcript_25693:748-1440(-)